MMIARHLPSHLLAGSRLLVVVAAALVLGIIGMHSLMAHDTGTSHEMHEMSVMAVSSSMDHDEGIHTGHDGGAAPHEGGMSDCGGLLSMCLAIAISLAGLVLWPRRNDVRALWRDRPALLLHLGEVRHAFEALSPLQRTAVIRC